MMTIHPACTAMDFIWSLRTSIVRGFSAREAARNGATESVPVLTEKPHNFCVNSALANKFGFINCLIWHDARQLAEDLTFSMTAGYHFHFCKHLYLALAIALDLS